jgi:methionyl-tRNA formyltransferase
VLAEGGACIFAPGLPETTSNGMENKAQQNLRIVFMGTPEFAVASLDALVREGFNVVGVITAPDKPAGRGLQLQESAVKKYAISQNLRVLQPLKLRDPEFLETLKTLQANVQVVVAFRMLPEVVWRMPPLGSINVHGSLLPQYRGAAPINWVLINGEKETGVTTFKLQQEIDTGNILLQERIVISEQETAGGLHDRMKEVGASLLIKTLNGIAEGTLRDVPQQAPPEGIKHAPKLLPDTGRIDWNQSVHVIYNLIRGLSPYPAAFTELQGKKLKIFLAEKEAGKPAEPPGTFITDKKTYLKYTCVDGFISVTELQLEGKKRMNTTAFLRGYRFGEGGL